MTICRNCTASYIGNFDEYLSDVNLANTTVGSKGDRLELTETYVKPAADRKH